MSLDISPFSGTVMMDLLYALDRYRAVLFVTGASCRYVELVKPHPKMAPAQGSIIFGDFVLVREVFT